MNLVLLGRHSDALSHEAAGLGKRTGQQIITFAVDLAESDAAEKVVRFVDSNAPHLDMLINNAAIQGPIGPVWTNDWSEWLQALQVNLISPIALCKAVAPLMIRQGRGSIINLSGGGATNPRPNFTAYATAKAGLVRFSETLAQELLPHNVRVNCIAPGAMNTAMLRRVIEHGPEVCGPKEHEAAQEIQRTGGASMQEVAALCMFLMSDAARGITGKLISAVWDPWQTLDSHIDELNGTDIYTLRRIVPVDRGKTWGDDL